MTGAADESWMRSGRCAGLDPATFFPSDGVGVVQAVQICRTCIVRERCLDHALENGIDAGVWGGVSERGRRKLRRSARLIVEAPPADDQQQVQPAGPAEGAHGR